MTVPGCTFGGRRVNLVVPAGLLFPLGAALFDSFGTSLNVSRLYDDIERNFGPRRQFDSMIVLERRPG